MDHVLAYMVDATGLVHDDEIAAQTAARLRALEQPVRMSAEAVRTHMLEHMLEQKIVLVHVLRVLLQVARSVKSIAVYEAVPPHEAHEEEEDSMALETPRGPHQVLDSKAMSVYLKAVDQVAAIYKMPSMAHLHSGASGSGSKSG